MKKGFLVIVFLILFSTASSGGPGGTDGGDTGPGSSHAKEVLAIIGNDEDSVNLKKYLTVLLFRLYHVKKEQNFEEGNEQRHNAFKLIFSDLIGKKGQSEKEKVESFIRSIHNLKFHPKFLSENKSSGKKACVDKHGKPKDFTIKGDKICVSVEALTRHDSILWEGQSPRVRANFSNLFIQMIVGVTHEFAHKKGVRDHKLADYIGQQIIKNHLLDHTKLISDYKYLVPLIDKNTQTIFQISKKLSTQDIRKQFCSDTDELRRKHREHHGLIHNWLNVNQKFFNEKIKSVSKDLSNSFDRWHSKLCGVDVEKQPIKKHHLKSFVSFQRKWVEKLRLTEKNLAEMKTPFFRHGSSYGKEFAQTVLFLNAIEDSLSDDMSLNRNLNFENDVDGKMKLNGIDRVSCELDGKKVNFFSSKFCLNASDIFHSGFGRYGMHSPFKADLINRYPRQCSRNAIVHNGKTHSIGIDLSAIDYFTGGRPWKDLIEMRISLNIHDAGDKPDRYNGQYSFNLIPLENKSMRYMTKKNNVALVDYRNRLDREDFSLRQHLLDPPEIHDIYAIMHADNANKIHFKFQLPVGYDHVLEKVKFSKEKFEIKCELKK